MYEVMLIFTREGEESCIDKVLQDVCEVTCVRLSRQICCHSQTMAPWHASQCSG